MFARRPLVYRRTRELPTKVNRGPAENSLAGRLWREIASDDSWALVAPQIRRLDWAFTRHAEAVMWLERHGYIKVEYRPARWLTEDVWARALPQET